MRPAIRRGWFAAASAVLVCVIGISAAEAAQWYGVTFVGEYPPVYVGWFKTVDLGNFLWSEAGVYSRVCRTIRQTHTQLYCFPSWWCLIWRDTDDAVAGSASSPVYDTTYVIQSEVCCSPPPKSNSEPAALCFEPISPRTVPATPESLDALHYYLRLHGALGSTDSVFSEVTFPVYIDESGLRFLDAATVWAEFGDLFQAHLGESPSAGAFGAVCDSLAAEFNRVGNNLSGPGVVPGDFIGLAQHTAALRDLYLSENGIVFGRLGKFTDAQVSLLQEINTLTLGGIGPDEILEFVDALERYKSYSYYRVAAELMVRVPGGTGGRRPTCPYVLAWDGQRFVEDNNILPLSEIQPAPDFNVRDAYPLAEPLIPSDGDLRLRIQEKDQDRTFLDRAGLVFCDLPLGVECATDDRGDLVFYHEIASSPVTARFERGDSTRVRFSFVEALGTGRGGLVVNGSNKLVTTEEPDKARDGAREIFPGQTQADVLGLQGGIDIDFEPEDGGLRRPIGSVVPREAVGRQFLPLHPSVSPTGCEMSIFLSFRGEHSVESVSLVEVVPAPAIEPLSMVSALTSESNDVASLVIEEDERFAQLGPGAWIDLTFEAPEPIEDSQRRFILLAAGYYLVDGVLVGPGDADGAARESGVGVEVLDSRPEAGKVDIRFRIQRPDRVAFHVFDTAGRHVARLSDEHYEPGEYRISWNGSDESGRPVGSGVYYLRFSTGGGAGTNKMLLVR